MDMKDSPTSLTILLANALQAQAHLPIIVGTDFIPLVWVDGRVSPEAMLLQARLTALSNSETLFLERAIKWLKPGGRLALVVPDGALSERSTEYARDRLLKHAALLAVISLPEEVFLRREPHAHEDKRPAHAQVE